MFRKTSIPGSSAPAPSKKIVPSVISANISILGNIISEGLVDFDGNIDGNIQCHSLLVRQNARINGEIRADSVQVSGRVYGTIRARVVTLQSTANVEGIVMHEQIIIEDGATVDGKLKKVTNSEFHAPIAIPIPTPPAFSKNEQHTKEESDEDTLIMEHIRLIAANS